MKILLFTIFTAGIFLVPMSSAKNNTSRDHWIEVIEQGEMSNVVKTFSDPNSKWPNLVSIYNQSFKESEQPWVDLAVNLVGLLREDFFKLQTEQEFFDAGQNYLKIEFALRDSGGYTNLVVANAFAIMAKVSLTRSLVEDPEKAAVIIKLLRSRNKNSSSSARNFLINYLEDDQILRNHKEVIEALKDDLNLIEIGNELGNAIPEIKAQNNIPKTTIEMIRRPSVLRLLAETSLSEMGLSVLLPGLADFFERGGEESDLDPGDVRKFSAIMGDSIDTYVFPMFGMRYLDVGRLLFLIKQSRENKAQEVLLNKIFSGVK